jgi:hypothetical protein
MKWFVRELMHKYNQRPLCDRLVKQVHRIMSKYFADIFMNALNDIKDGRSKMSYSGANRFLLQWLNTDKDNRNCTEADAQTYKTCIADLQQSRRQSPRKMLADNAIVATIYINVLISM